MWDGFAVFFCPWLCCALQLRNVDDAFVECKKSAWKGPMLSLLHIQISIGYILVCRACVSPTFGHCSIHRSGDQYATCTDSRGKHRPGNIPHHAGCCATVESTSDEHRRHCSDCNICSTAKQVHPSRPSNGNGLCWALRVRLSAATRPALGWFSSDHWSPFETFPYVPLAFCVSDSDFKFVVLGG